MDSTFLFQEIKEDSQTIPIIGFLVFWNSRQVSLTKDKFSQLLTEVGFADSIREHNYRSTFIRALHDMEEARIIRRVKEDGKHIIMQFTAESLVNSSEGEALDYERETIVVVDKARYREFKDFRKALIQGKPEIIDKLVSLFNEHRELYNSKDVTRFIQKTLKDQADVVSLRQQGNVYFVPAIYKDVLDRIGLLLSKVGNSKLEYLPIPNVQACRSLVEAALKSEFANDLNTLEFDVDGADQVSKRWTTTRLDRVTKLLNRLHKYHGGGIISDDDKASLEASATEIQQKVLGIRVLDL